MVYGFSTNQTWYQVLSSFSKPYYLIYLTKAFLMFHNKNKILRSKHINKSWIMTTQTVVKEEVVIVREKIKYFLTRVN